MKEKKRLKLYANDPNCFYSPPTAFLFNILSVYMETDKNILPWIVSNFINICVDVNFYTPDISETLVFEDYFRQNLWYSCPFLSIMDLKADYIHKIYGDKDFVSLVKDAINLEYYVYADLNRRYIPNYQTEQDVQHNLLIYGYNDYTYKVNIADYFRKHIFSMEECGYNNINQAFWKLDKVVDYEKFNCINLLKYRKCDNYKFNLRDIRNNLIDYLESRDLLEKYHYALFAYEYKNSGMLYYGISYYDALIEMLREKRNFSTRVIHLLVMHKSVLKKQLHFLKEKKIITGNELNLMLEEILKNTISLRNYILKSHLINDSKKILDDLEQSKVKEKILLLKEKDIIYTQMLIKAIS